MAIFVRISLIRLLIKIDVGCGLYIYNVFGSRKLSIIHLSSIFTTPLLSPLLTPTFPPSNYMLTINKYMLNVIVCVYMVHVCVWVRMCVCILQFGLMLYASVSQWEKRNHLESVFFAVFYFDGMQRIYAKYSKIIWSN